MGRLDDVVVGNNLVENLKQQENGADEQIYNELAALFPYVQSPLVQYERVDSGYMAACRSEQAVRWEANDVSSRADTELVNKRKCIEAERKARHEQVLATHLTTPPPTNNKVKEDQSVSPVKPGQYVFVAQDLSPGKFSHGGEVWVKAVHGTGGSIVCDVEYIKNTGGNVTREEKAVPLSCLTVKINAWHAAQLGDSGSGSYCESSHKHQRQEPTKFFPPQKETKSKESKPLKDILSLACQSGKSKGWRAREMGFDVRWSKKNAHFCDCFCHDLAELKGFLSAVPEKWMHSDCGSDGTWKAQKKQHNPFTIKYLQYAWGVGLHYAASLVASEQDMTKIRVPKQATNKKSKCVIENHEAAKAWYTPLRLFIDKWLRNRKGEAETSAYESWKEKHHEWREEAKAEWVLLTDAKKEEWKFHAWNHDKRQPYIRDQIIEAIQNNPTKSFDKIEADIDHWCSATTIQNWLASYPLWLKPDYLFFNNLFDYK
jgi:hypothetical protein